MKKVEPILNKDESRALAYKLDNSRTDAGGKVFSRILRDKQPKSGGILGGGGFVKDITSGGSYWYELTPKSLRDLADEIEAIEAKNSKTSDPSLGKTELSISIYTSNFIWSAQVSRPPTLAEVAAEKARKRKLLATKKDYIKRTQEAIKKLTEELGGEEEVE